MPTHTIHEHEGANTFVGLSDGDLLTNPGNSQLELTLFHRRHLAMS